MKWQVIDKGITSNKSITSTTRRLLENRGLKTKKEIDDFLSPKKPEDIGIKIPKNILKRLQKAKKKREKIVIFGDYDCDGVCATAILWENLYKNGYNIIPYIPDRFTEGYGLKRETFENAKFQTLNAKLIICVDNGIVACEAVKEAKKRGIDVIVVDHHQKGDKKLATPYILHSTIVCGSALSWFLSSKVTPYAGLHLTMLELVAIGTVADQMPLLGINRSIVKYGLEELNKTKRLGLKSLIRVAGLTNIGVYEIGFIIAPRINAMGRLSHAMDSLRLVCTRDTKKAEELAKVLNETNIERQKIVEDVLSQTLEQVQSTEKIVVVDGNYHEGVIGLASGKITEKFYKPSIVISKGEHTSKASARSIVGFNIIEAIKETGLILEGGGHPMAAGFSIETTKIDDFRLKIQELAHQKLTEEMLEKKLKIDLEINFSNISNEFVELLKQFEPTGYGNTKPIFMTKKVKVVESKAIGQDGKHLKLKLSHGEKVFDAIWFSFSNAYPLVSNGLYNIAYSIEQNEWSGHSQIQLKIKDIKIN